jgi:uncharacterized protein YjbI with pentapeptide repeats
VANPEQVAILKSGVDRWNHWRRGDENVSVDLREADLSRMVLSGADLHGADMYQVNLVKAECSHVDLSDAFLPGAVLHGSDLSYADLRRTVLTRAECYAVTFDFANMEGVMMEDCRVFRSTFSHCILSGAGFNSSAFANTEFGHADLSKSFLKYCTLVGCNFSNANLSGSHVYGVSVWDAVLDTANQSDLVITHESKAPIQVDNLEVAQFIYLLLNNQNIRHVIDTITSKVVLILGRFTPERKAVLDAIRVELRKRNYLPVLFDFDKPSNRDITETVSTLAHMARFVIADITDARSIPQELMAIVPTLPSVPVQPLLLASQREYGMFEHYKRYPWVLEPYLYDDQEGLLAAITDKVIGPAEGKAKEQTGRYTRQR